MRGKLSKRRASFHNRSFPINALAQQAQAVQLVAASNSRAILLEAGEGIQRILLHLLLPAQILKGQ